MWARRVRARAEPRAVAAAPAVTMAAAGEAIWVIAPPARRPMP